MSKIKIVNTLYYDWWKNIDKIILLLIFTLVLLGAFFSFVSTSLIASTKLGTNSYYFFLRHLVFISLGIVLIITSSLLKEKHLYKMSLILFIIFLISLFCVPFFGEEIKGSRRWLDISFLPRFQPIELMKPFLIVVLSLIISSEKYSNNYFKFFLSFLVVFPIITLLVMQPDIGQTVLISLVWLSLIFVSGINLYFFNLFIFILLSSLTFLIIFVPKFIYIKNRLISFIDLSSKGNYQAEKASEAIINGGFFGKGIGEGTLNVRVPEAHTDYVISVISEEFGIIFILLIMLIFLTLTFKIFKKISKEKKNSQKLVLIGSTLIILLQVFVHIGVNIRLLPTTGMTLPFLSYGGSSILSTSIFSGIILNFTRRKLY